MSPRIDASPTCKILWATLQFNRAIVAGVSRDTLHAAIVELSATHAEFTSDEIVALVDAVIAKHRGSTS